MSLFWRGLSILALLLRCSGRSSDPPMPEDRFVDLCVRMERLNRRYAASPDSLRLERENLLRAQGVQREDIERAIVWYRQRPDRGLRALEKIAERLEAEEKSRIQETGDRIQNEKPSRD
ncbi:MAG: hypothetical protein A3F84_04225 [Candidatus Handelsmanbacteria bacterium RIFCSPLOWO2_12_FULL_64_10]|uniref:DUF4296 domain-containing protein n=1 Tax=Handelsmanbacteria sp. (strain RIFCSPLOWO2_12_FULL_64_10) TaxID=1817868 RepID=A0A1F6D6V6_HANXR|nr:MAG: hypothetical protein A3F84_04225 [Candidatus Handelsmanbacteria bacterium RIFCSPLOWO2_12_FULL_64_10]